MHQCSVDPNCVRHCPVGEQVGILRTAESNPKRSLCLRWTTGCGLRWPALLTAVVGLGLLLQPLPRPRLHSVLMSLSCSRAAPSSHRG